jgi:hypothetical protein
MKKYCFIVCFVFLYCSIILSQTDFKPGFIISKNDDTTYGLIDARGSIRNAKICNFKKDINSDIIAYKPSNLSGYRFIDGKYYISKEITKDNQREKVFLEFLIHGKADIYYLRDENNEHYYLQKLGDSIIELKTTEHEVIKDNRSYIITNKKYIGVLKSKLSDVPSLGPKIENTQLNSKSLISLAKDYHNKVCYDTACIIYEKKTPKFKLKFGILIGDISTLKGTIINFNDEEIYMKQPFAPAIGLFLNYPLPQFNEHLSIQYELMYKRNSYQAEFYYTPYVDKSYTPPVGAILLNSSSFYHSIFMKYDIPKKKTGTFLQAGLFINNYKHRSSFSYNSNRVEYYDFRCPFGFSCGIGSKYQFSKNNDIFIRLLYYFGVGDFSYTDFNGVNLGSAQNFILHDFNLTLGFTIF